MEDRSNLIAIAAAVALVIGALAVLIRKMTTQRLLMGRVFSFSDVDRWFKSGIGRMRPLWAILPFLAGSICLFSVLTNLTFQREARVRGAESALAFSWPSATLIFGAWPRLVPLYLAQGHWFLAMYPLLLLLRAGGRYPFQEGSDLGNRWLTISRPALVLWAIYFASAVSTAYFGFREPPTWLNEAMPIYAVVGILVWLLLGYAFTIPPLLASVDEQTAQGMSKSRSQLETFTTLVLLQVLCAVPQFLQFALSFISGRYFDSPWLRSTKSFLGILGAVTGPFFVTATIPACSSGQLRKALRITMAWWKQHFALLGSITLALGVISWALTALARLFNSAFFRLPPLQALFAGLIALASLGASVASFGILIGNWFEFRDSIPGAASISDSEVEKPPTAP